MSQLVGPKERVRHVSNIIYPEDVTPPADMTVYGRIVGYMDYLHVVGALSPLHDKDVWSFDDVEDWVHSRVTDGMDADEAAVIRAQAPKVGDPKKPHYHFMLKFDGWKSARQLTEMMDGLCHIRSTSWRKVQKWDGYLRYLAHIGCQDENKAPYSAAGVVGFAGCDLSPLYRQDEISRLNAIKEVREYIQESGIRRYDELLDWAVTGGVYDYIATVKGNNTMWCQYLAGRGTARKEAKEKHAGIREGA